MIRTILLILVVVFVLFSYSGCNLFISLLDNIIEEDFELLISPESARIAMGSNFCFSLLKKENGNTIDVSSSASWHSDNPLVLEIYFDGCADAYNPGTVKITVEYEKKSVTSIIEVYDPDIQTTPEPTPESTPEPTPDPTNSPPGMMAANYTFDGNCDDYSGNKKNATPYNINYTTDRFGMPASAAYFNGSDAYADTPFLWNYNLSFSFSVWLQPGTMAGELMIMGNCSSTILYDGFWAQFKNGQHRFHHIDSIILLDSNFIPGQWRHVTYVYDHIAMSCSLYVDGEYIVGGPVVYTDFTAVLTNKIGAIGSGDLSSMLFSGSMDDMLIYERALTSVEISDLYASQAP